MARLHLKFRNINRRTQEAARTLFESGPWSGTDEERHSKFEAFLSAASAVYRVPTPTLEIDQRRAVLQRRDGYVLGRITLSSWSVVSLFHYFRHHLQAMGSVAADPEDCDDAQSWACSLFYSVRPRQFRRSVREGRIIGVNPDDLLSSETLARRLNEMYEDEAPVDSPLSLEVDTATGSHDRLRPEEDDETTPSVPVVDRSGTNVVEIDSATIQDTYGVSRSFVSTNAAAMGGWKPEGSARWKFNAEIVAAYFERRSATAR